MRILVYGGRDYSDRDRMWSDLDRLLFGRRITRLVHGAARGADSLAGEWAEERGVPVDVYPADWETYGKGAGFIRNQLMADSRLDGAVCYPGGNGTADMTRRLQAKGVRIWNR